MYTLCSGAEKDNSGLVGMPLCVIMSKILMLFVCSTGSAADTSVELFSNWRRSSWRGTRGGLESAVVGTVCWAASFYLNWVKLAYWLPCVSVDGTTLGKLWWVYRLICSWLQFDCPLYLSSLQLSLSGRYRLKNRATTVACSSSQPTRPVLHLSRCSDVIKCVYFVTPCAIREAFPKKVQSP